MARELKLENSDEVALVDDEDYDDLSRYEWHHIKGTGYAQGTVNGRRWLMHRYIMRHADQRMQIDHKDKNPLNNTRENLRTCTVSQNAQNRRKRRDSAHSYKGVVLDRGRWRASIKHDGKRHWLGFFTSEFEAAKAYDLKAVEFFGEFALLNFPEESRGDVCR